MSYSFEEEKNSIREKLIKQGYGNKRIGYQEFVQLYEPYKEKMSENEFAYILGINYAGLQHIKHKGSRTVILEMQSISEKRKQLRKDKNGNVYFGEDR